MKGKATNLLTGLHEAVLGFVLTWGFLHFLQSQFSLYAVVDVVPLGVRGQSLPLLQLC